MGTIGKNAGGIWEEQVTLKNFENPIWKPSTGEASYRTYREVFKCSYSPIRGQCLLQTPQAIK